MAYAQSRERSWTNRTLAGGLWDSPPARIWLLTSLFFVISLLPTVVALNLDARQLNGVSVWAKPLKFQVASVIYLLTLAVLAGLTEPRRRDGWLLRATAWVSSAMALVEVAYISLQAARGRHSHFNSDTPFEAAMFSVMGFCAVVLILAALVVGWHVLRNPRPGVGEGLRWTSGLGLILGFWATLLVAGYLGGHGSHWVGGIQDDAAGLPFFGWSTSGGDLRVPHFFATHMMQALPLLGLLIDRAPGSRASARHLSVVAALLWSAGVAALFWQAVNGIPFLTL